MHCARAVEKSISHATGRPFLIRQFHEAGGGCINQAWLVENENARYFVKTNPSGLADMFAAEAEGLIELESASALRVPHPLAHGIANGESFLILEYLELGMHGDADEMGKKLAAQHHKTASRFGWKRDNTIGSTPQPNQWSEDWVDFYRTHRLGFQLGLAAANGFLGRMQTLGEKLLSRLDVFFPGYQPVPSLLHGDLWGGNAAYSRSGEPVIFDPAVYYGDREADLAMTELFGGFSQNFYAAYHDAWPLDPGYSTRKTLYNLYHVINHANLFGGSYTSQAESMMARLLAEAS